MTAIFLMLELRQLLSVKSIIRYLPPKGTAGFARCMVRGCRRSPFPPARIIASTSFISLSFLSHCMKKYNHCGVTVSRAADAGGRRLTLLCCVIILYEYW